MAALGVGIVGAGEAEAFREAVGGSEARVGDLDRVEGFGVAGEMQLSARIDWDFPQSVSCTPSDSKCFPPAGALLTRTPSTSCSVARSPCLLSILWSLSIEIGKWELSSFDR